MTLSSVSVNSVLYCYVEVCVCALLTRIMGYITCVFVCVLEAC